MDVLVRGDDIEGAIKLLKKNYQREGIWKELKKRQSSWKPSDRRRVKESEARVRLRKRQKGRHRLEG